MPFKDLGTCQLTTPLGKDVLILRGLSASESISELFDYQLDLVSHESEIDPADIVGKSVCVQVDVGGDVFRYFHGLVARFSQGAASSQDREDIVAYRAQVVPWMWLLTRSSDCRVWEDKTVIEILDDVLGDKKYGDGCYDFQSLTEKYEPIEYCVQYQESDFNFVCRMMEEEGLFFWFRHESDNHTLVISDASAAQPDCPNFESMDYAGLTSSGGSMDQVENWCVDQELLSGKLAVNGYDFKNPSDDLLSPTQSKISLGGNANLEIYEFPTNYCESKQGERYARLKMERLEAESHEIWGSSLCPGLLPGNHVTLQKHYVDAYNGQRYLLTRVDHHLTQSIGHGGAETAYENTFTCLPERIAYRPPRRTPKPLIHGIQTATVVGPGGEEIHCDKYGRVRLQFPWFRDGAGDGTGVCYARCAQSAAGKKFGGIFIPRIGQEVVVQFIDGDPDRPLVTGVVYNGEQMPPYDLPANKTRSGIKTRSSKGGAAANCNEILMEDKKGSESLFIQAEKDEEIVVKNDKTESIGNNETVSVGKDRTESVGASESLSVASNRSRTVGATETITIAAARTLNVGVNDMTNVGAAQEVTVGGAQAVTVGAAQVTSVGGNRSVNAGGHQTENVGGNFTVKAGSNVQISSSGDITLNSGAAKLVLKKSGDILLQGNKIQIKGKGDVVVKGSKISEN